MAILAGNHHKSHDRRDLSRISAFIYYGIFGNQALISRFSVSINLFNIFFVKASSLHLAISLIFRRTKFLILLIIFFFFSFLEFVFFYLRSSPAGVGVVLQTGACEFTI